MEHEPPIVAQSLAALRHPDARAYALSADRWPTLLTISQEMILDAAIRAHDSSTRVPSQSSDPLLQYLRATDPPATPFESTPPEFTELWEKTEKVRHAALRQTGPLTRYSMPTRENIRSVVLPPEARTLDIGAEWPIAKNWALDRETDMVLAGILQPQEAATDLLVHNLAALSARHTLERLMTDPYGALDPKAENLLAHLPPDTVAVADVHLRAQKVIRTLQGSKIPGAVFFTQAITGTPGETVFKDSTFSRPVTLLRDTGIALFPSADPNHPGFTLSRTDQNTLVYALGQKLHLWSLAPGDPRLPQ